MISDLQVKALEYLAEHGGRATRTWDGRLTFPLVRKGLIRLIEGDDFEITDVGRQILDYEKGRPAEISMVPAVIMERIRSIPLPERLRPQVMMKATPSGPVSEIPPPAPDGMSEVCCAPGEQAVSAGAMRRAASSSALYVVSSTGSHWPVRFCPFCGRQRGDVLLYSEDD